MDKIDTKSLIARIRANKAILDSCSQHDFQTEKNELGSDWICKNCNGRADSTAVMWYERGLQHGMGVVDGEL